MVRDFFAEPDHANLRLVVGAGEVDELWVNAQLVANACSVIDDLISALDDEGFGDALPGEGLHLPSDDPAAWRALLAGIHGLSEMDVSGPMAAPPLVLTDVRLLCFCSPCAPSAIRVVVGDRVASECGAWEFYCDCDVLSGASEFFAAMLQPGRWRESCMQRVLFPVEDVEILRHVLTIVHSSCHATPYSSDLGLAIRVLRACHTYLFDAQFKVAQEILRDRPELIGQVVALEPTEFLDLARELASLGVLLTVLGSWCLFARGAIARHMATLLKDKDLAAIALSSRAVIMFLASPDFLSAEGTLDADGPLVALAARGELDLLNRCTNWSWIRGPADVKKLLNEDFLVTLLQLPGLKRELRDLRFCDVSLAPSLAPFPSLFDELLFEWFSEKGCNGGSLQLSPLELANWISYHKFRRLDVVGEQLESATPHELCTFIMAAPLHDVAVEHIARERLSSLSSEVWSLLFSLDRPALAADAAAAFFANKQFLKKLAMHPKATPPFAMARLLFCIVFHAWFAPLQDLTTIAFFCARQMRNSLHVFPRGLASHVVRSFLAVAKTAMLMITYEAWVLRVVTMSICGVGVVVSETLVSCVMSRAGVSHWCGLSGPKGAGST